MIRMALTKGRLLTSTLGLFRTMGIDPTPIEQAGRRLILPLTDGLEVVLAKPNDVLTYVEHGVCDAGIVGKDTLMEAGGGSYFEVADLGFGRCRFAVAAREGSDLYGGYRIRRIASKYPRVAKAHFAEKQMDVEVIKIEGSVELAPLLGLADGIVDIVETGATLRANQLAVIETVAELSARLIVGRTSLKLKRQALDGLLAQVAVAKETRI